jgi:hypothetical protein
MHIMLFPAAAVSPAAIVHIAPLSTIFLMNIVLIHIILTARRSVNTAQMIIIDKTGIGV